MDTLFGYLATRFAASTENIAIEALGYILNRSEAARRAFIGLASTGGKALPSDLLFSTQSASDDGSRPDIEGCSPDQKRRCVVECKFWAGLTANQPATYALRLPEDLRGALVFIVPSARLPILWTELVNRLTAAGYPVGTRQEITAEVWYAPFGAGHQFVLTSWRAVLTSILGQMENSREVEAIEDARQLLGLCERMDSEAFLPFRSEELTAADTPARYIQLGKLAWDIGEALLADDRIDRKGLTTASGAGYYGRYLRVFDTIFLVAFDCRAWAAYRRSPLWIKIDGASYPQAASILMAASGRSNAFEVTVERDRSILVPVPISHSCERQVIIGEAAEFIRTLCTHLAASQGTDHLVAS